MQHVYSARLHELDSSIIGRVMRLHKRMGHASEDVMVAAVRECWINTSVIIKDIRRVFNREPCLVCVLAKRNKDSVHRWSRKKKVSRKKRTIMMSDGTSDMVQEFCDNKSTVVTDIHMAPDSNIEDIDVEQWAIGECISVDNIGPINPASLEGYTGYFMFRDTKSRMVFTYPINQQTRTILFLI